MVLPLIDFWWNSVMDYFYEYRSWNRTITWAAGEINAGYGLRISPARGGTYSLLPLYQLLSYSNLNRQTPTLKNISANPSRTPTSGNMFCSPPPRRTRSSIPCIAHVVGSTFTAFWMAGGNSSSGYQHPPINAKTMPNIILNPLA